MLSAKAPYEPEVSSPTDTSNFEDVATEFSTCDTQPPKVTAAFTGHHLPFIGFTYTHDSPMSDQFNLQTSAAPAFDVDATPPASPDTTTRANARVERRNSLIERHEAEKAELRQQIADLLPDDAARDAAQAQEQLIAQLRDEIQILHKRLEDESTKSSVQKPTKDANVEELERRIRELKDKNCVLILEKQDFQRDADEHNERLGDLQSNQVCTFVLIEILQIATLRASSTRISTC